MSEGTVVAICMASQKREPVVYRYAALVRYAIDQRKAEARS